MAEMTKKNEFFLLKEAALSEGGYYVPPYEELADAIPLPADPKSNVTLSADMFRFLMRGWLVHQFFDEASYLNENPDVKKAVKEGRLSSGWEHYVGIGYFEGRSPGRHFIDVNWYRTVNKDIALAERKGRISAEEHFERTGRNEKRAGSESHKWMIAEWRNALKLP